MFRSSWQPLSPMFAWWISHQFSKTWDLCKFFFTAVEWQSIPNTVRSQLHRQPSIHQTECCTCWKYTPMWEYRCGFGGTLDVRCCRSLRPITLHNSHDANKLFITQISGFLAWRCLHCQSRDKKQAICTCLTLEAKG